MHTKQNDATPQGPCAPPQGPAADPARREFLGTAFRLAGGAVVFFAGLEVAGQASASESHAGPAAHPEGYNWDEHRWAYVIDTAKCIGCGACVRGCRAENAVPDGFYRTWVERYVIGGEHRYVDSPKGGIEGFPPAQTPFAQSKSFFVPKLCNHCKETPCVQVCPVGASYRTRDGVVLVDDSRCIGCGYCVQACPYGSRFLDPVDHTAQKCTWCYHRITKGLKPACVEVCPTGTRLFGDMKKEGDPVREIIEKERVSILQPHHLTEPQAYYLNLDKDVR